MTEHGVATARLTEVRHQLTEQQKAEVIAALQETIVARDSPSAVTHRDAAWWDRAGGWPGRLRNVITKLAGADPSAELVPGDLRLQTVNRLLIADLAIQIFRDRNDRLPESMAELAPLLRPENSIDPYSGNPLIYRREGKSYRLYSVGRDLLDDGGQFSNWQVYLATQGFDLDLDTQIRKW
jgi:hypothetical protein